MMRLEMKNYNMILTLSALSSGKIHKYEYLKIYYHKDGILRYISI